jgi:transposase
MEDRLWTIVLSFLPPEQGDLGRDTYSVKVILMVGLWAILHDRPFKWACCPEHWPEHRRPEQLPHASTLSRRWRRDDLAEAAHQVYLATMEQLPCEGNVVAIDGKPLIISDVSKDPDARNGRGTRGMARGYKLHAVTDAQGVVRTFEVTSLNVNERKPAQRLLRELPPSVRRAVADGNYDGAPLHRCLEGSGVKLYTPLINNYAGPRTHLRRRVLVRLLQHPIGQKLLHWRDQIDRCFGLMGNVGFGLKGLPNWVRRQHRVARWIWGKIVLYHALKITYAQNA